jgi:hypothetical protein
MSYAEYKFGKAMRALSDLNGRQRPWLASAEVYLLSQLRDEEVPTEIRLNFSQFKQVIAQLQAKYAKQSLEAMAAAATDSEVADIADRFLKLYEAMPR